VQGKRIFLGVSGSIAAYKAVELSRLLIKSGVTVRVGLSHGAQAFIQPLTFEALTQNPVLTSLLDAGQGQIEHVEQAHAVDLVLVAPASANLIARMAAGMADDIVAATCLSSTAPIVLAPAMETGMWNHPATQANIDTLKGRGVIIVEPESGDLASGRSGVGRLAQLDVIVAAVASCFRPNDLLDKHFVITAGPTHEKLDPVRLLSNRSTGAMGIAFASAAADRGAKVDLIIGPTHLSTPDAINTHRVESAQDMLHATESVIDSADVFIAAAAVSDFRLSEPSTQKLKRNQAGAMTLNLVENPDILATLSPRVKDGVVVGFAAETEDIEANARVKLERKGCDFVVANQVGPAQGFGPGETEVLLVQEDAETLPFGPASKSKVAGFVLNQVVKLLDRKGNP
jgi:phosphopantothenoylcysteine decarboxylase/phosphopantothenate--cysteine ligase